LRCPLSLHDALPIYLGTAMVLGLTTLTVLSAAQLPRVYWWSLFGLGVVLLPVLWSNLRDYQLQRIQTFLQPTADPLGTGYNVIRSEEHTSELQSREK